MTMSRPTPSFSAKAGGEVQASLLSGLSSGSGAGGRRKLLVATPPGHPLGMADDPGAGRSSRRPERIMGGEGAPGGEEERPPSRSGGALNQLLLRMRSTLLGADQ